jgi:hypothetical protein
MGFLRIPAVLGLIAALSITAWAWAPGTHAYIANAIYPGNPDNVIFGSIAPDINQILSTDQNSVFFKDTHYDVMGMWASTSLVPTPSSKPLALGFLTHNEAWGADHYAHITSHLYPRYVNTDPRYQGQNGYVWVKAGQLCSLMKQQTNGMGGLATVLLSDPMNCHFIVEYAMDLLLKSTRDPQIGQKLLAAASNYNEETLQALFMAGYPQPVSAGNATTTGMVMAFGEGTWAGLMKGYASALNQPTLKEAVPAVSGFLELLAEQLLQAQLQAALGLPPGAPIPKEVGQQLSKLIELGLVDSLMLCSYDYPLELNMTIHSVEQNLRKRDIRF